METLLVILASLATFVLPFVWMLRRPWWERIPGWSPDRPQILGHGIGETGLIWLELEDGDGPITEGSREYRP